MRSSTIKINLNAIYNIVSFEDQPSDLMRLDICGEFIFETEIQVVGNNRNILC